MSLPAQIEIDLRPPKIAIIGSGIIGATIAHRLSKSDMEITLFEKDARPNGASVRNFGLIWISGRRGGEELRLALESRKIWSEVSSEIPGISFSENGSLTLLTSEAEIDLANEAINSDPSNSRRLAVITPNEVESKYKVTLVSSVKAAIECELDAVVDPNHAVIAILEDLSKTPNVTVRVSTQVASIAERTVKTVHGDHEEFDVVIVATGTAGIELISPYGLPENIGISTTSLAMASTHAATFSLAPTIADSDSLRYYPFFQPFVSKHLSDQDPLPLRHGAQLLARQLTDGTIILGDSHYYDQPTRFKVDIEIVDHFRAKLGSLLNADIPSLESVWTGSYTRTLDPIRPYVAHPVADGILYVTAAGGMGMTLSWAIADEVKSWIQARPRQ